MARDLIKTVLHDQVPRPPVAPGAPSMKEPVEEDNISPVRDLDLAECLEDRWGPLTSALLWTWVETAPSV